MKKIFDLSLKPKIVPKKLISKDYLDRLVDEGFLKYYMLVNDDLKYCFHQGRLCLNLCYYESWNLKGKIFEKWLRKLQHNIHKDLTSNNMKVAYFNYYALYY